MKNRNMKQKITIAFGAVVICFFVTVGVLFYGMVNISTRYTQFYKNNHEAIVHVDKVKIYTLAAGGDHQADDRPGDRKCVGKERVR